MVAGDILLPHRASVMTWFTDFFQNGVSQLHPARVLQYKMPVHYKESDEWVDIDNTLTPVQGTQENSASARTFSSTQTKAIQTSRG